MSQHHGRCPLTEHNIEFSALRKREKYFNLEAYAQELEETGRYVVSENGMLSLDRHESEPLMIDDMQSHIANLGKYNEGETGRGTGSLFR